MPGSKRFLDLTLSGFYAILSGLHKNVKFGFYLHIKYAASSF
jgi:hypothetical protein